RRECRPGRGADPPPPVGGVRPLLVRELAPRHVEEQPAPLVPEALDQPWSDRWLAVGEPSEAPEDVGDDLAEDRPAGIEAAAELPVAPPVPRDQEREERAGVGAESPDRIELRRGVETRLVGLDDPYQSVAVHVTTCPDPPI